VLAAQRLDRRKVLAKLLNRKMGILFRDTTFNFINITVVAVDLSGIAELLLSNGRELGEIAPSICDLLRGKSASLMIW
jgi:hypothetical protein